MLVLVFEEEEQQTAFLHILPLVRATYFTAREQTLSDPYFYGVTVMVYKPTNRSCALGSKSRDKYGYWQTDYNYYILLFRLMV